MAVVAIWGALIVAFLAARVALRTRAVFLLGRRGHLTAPAVVASFWVTGVLLGQVTHSLAGMAWAGAVVLIPLALLARARFSPLQAHHRLWTAIDLAIVGLLGVLFWLTDRWDFDCHRAIVGQFLHGNLPPTALNDARAPLAYHAIYDALVALVMTALPLELDQGMAVVSIACVALTVTNLRAVTRAVFRSPVAAQLGRVLFAFGYGPVLVRYFQEGRDIDALHGRTSQSYADIILRRPAGLGFAFYTLALALALPIYRNDPRAPALDSAGERRAWTALAFLIPTCALLPQMAEETILYLGLLLLPLVVRGRLPWRLVGVLMLAGLIGIAQSGVVRGVLGQGTMATPHPHLSWPPTLPSWSFGTEGIPVWSRNGFQFFALELGPAFLAAFFVALFSRQPRRRILALPFIGGLMVAALVRPTGWPKCDLDRFLFYGTPPLFMLIALAVDRAALRWRRGHLHPAALKAFAFAVAIVIAGAPAMFPANRVLDLVRDGFTHHALGGDLKRDLNAVGPHEAILTTHERANDLLQAGFIVIAPLETHDVARVTDDRFDTYVRDNAQRAAWLFLPENDARVSGQEVRGRHDGFVLVRPHAGASGPTLSTR